MVLAPMKIRRAQRALRTDEGKNKDKHPSIQGKEAQICQRSAKEGMTGCVPSLGDSTGSDLLSVVSAAKRVPSASDILGIESEAPSWKPR
jgi:hypothetical protein